MSYDSPASSLPVRAAPAKHSSLWDELLPSPPAPLRRTASTGVVGCFLLVVLALALLAPGRSDTELVREQGWLRHSSVSWGMPLVKAPAADELKSEPAPAPGVWAGEWDKTDKTGMDMGTPALEVETNDQRTLRVAGLLEGGLLSSYVWHEQLTEWSSASRMLVVGDLHGTHDSLRSLLARLSYDRVADTLLHVGDLVAKGSLNDSIETVQLMRQLSVKGVRGNHDQGVVEWRNWMESYGGVDVTLPAVKDSKAVGPTATEEPGMRPAGSMSNPKAASAMSVAMDHRLQPQARGPAPIEPPGWIPTPVHDTHDVDHVALLSSGALLGEGWTWLDLTQERVEQLGVVVPSTWKGKTRGWGGEWFEIARHLAREDALYLKSLPLTLYAAELRTYLVHAGMLPWAVSPPPLSPILEPAPLPSLLNSTSPRIFTPVSQLAELLSTPERSLLLVPQNTDPFTLTNMRGVRVKHLSAEKYVPGKDSKGRAWYNIWAARMATYCKGQTKCLATNVLYGHWAGKDLTIRDYTIGLDSGCVYGRRLSVLVIPSLSKRDGVSPLQRVEKEVVRLAPRQAKMIGIADDALPPPTVIPVDGEDGDDDESATTASPAAVPTNEDLFEEESLSWADSPAWVVSVSCAGRA